MLCRDSRLSLLLSVFVAFGAGGVVNVQIESQMVFADPLRWINSSVARL